MKNTQNDIDERMIDYRNVDLLKKFINPHARILQRSRTRLSAKKQRTIAKAVKHARFMGILPYIGR